MADTLPAQVTALALDRINDIAQLSVTLKDDALGMMESLKTQAEDLLTALDGVTFEPDFAGIDADYTAPTIPTDEPDAPADAPDMPTLSTLVDVGSFTYTDTPYTALVKTQIQSVLTAVLGGTGLLSDAVYDALWSRVEADLLRTQTAAEWDATDAGARLGWKLPTEATLTRLDAAADTASRASAKARLEQILAEATQRREDKKAAISDGTQFENVWIGEHNARQTRLLEAEMKRIEGSIAINNALIAQDDLALKAFGIQWAAILQRIQAVVELWKGRLAPVTAAIESERVRLGFETLKQERAMGVETEDTKLEVTRAATILPHMLGTLTSIAQMTAGLAQAALSASDVSVGTSAPWGYSETHSYCEKQCA